MPADTNIVLLYAALLLLATALVVLSIVMLKLLWRERRAASDTQQAVATQMVGVPSDNDKALSEDQGHRKERPPSSSYEFTERDYPPPRNRLHYRLRYEPIGELAKEKRIKAAQDRQNVRLALSSLAAKGTFVFDDIVTEEGSIDFLTLSRSGIHVVLVFTEEGYVWRDPTTDLIRSADRTCGIDPDTGYERLQGDNLPENPDIFSSEIIRAYHKDVGVVRGEASWKLYCFTRAEIQRPSEYTNRPRLMSTLIDLATWIDWKDESEFTITEDRVHELAAITEEVYSRKPIVRPLEVESGP